MAPVTITIDTDSEPESPKISKSKSKTKTTVIESSSPFHNLSSSSQADLTLPDAALLFGLKAIKQPLKSTSLSNNHVKPSKTKASSGKFRYAGLQNLSSPPPGLMPPLHLQFRISLTRALSLLQRIQSRIPPWIGWIRILGLDWMELEMGVGVGVGK